MIMKISDIENDRKYGIYYIKRMRFYDRTGTETGYNKLFELLER